MLRKHQWLVRLALAAIIMVLAAGPALAANPASPAAAPQKPGQRLVMRAKSPASFATLKADAIKAGAKIVVDRPEANLLVVTAPDAAVKAQLNASPAAAAVGADHLIQLIRPALQEEFLGKALSPNPERTRIQMDGSKFSGPPGRKVTPDPAFNLLGLMWNVYRVNADRAWSRPRGMGAPEVLVGVADTGLDYTHVELAGQVAHVEDLTDPTLCKEYFGTSDAELALALGGPADGDFNGHGSWIGGNIAGAMNGTGINGIAPKAKLVSLKIAEWCGYAWDTSILDAFMYAADNKIDIVSISFGGYLDRSDPDQDAIYQAYVDVVKYAWAKGTVIVAAAGNEHTRIGAGGQVISHGILDVTPGGTDYYGYWENPGGIPLVVDVSATGNVVEAPSSAPCPADSLAAGNHQWCKPVTDAHQATGIGKQNQLTYYSNYGPRIDVAAPGGARKFNVPAADRGGTEGWPWTGQDSIYGGTSVSDGYKDWEAFSITSNFATQIPCFTFTGMPGFPDDQCYSPIQGTSMATPHVSAVMAIIASENPGMRHNPRQLVQYLKSHALRIRGNQTTAVSATDTSPMDRTGAACTNGFCHLGGPVISDADAYGAGLVSAAGAPVP